MKGNEVTCINCGHTGQYVGDYIICHNCKKSLYVKKEDNSDKYKVAESLIHDIVRAVCLFAVEGTRAKSVATLSDGTKEFIDSLTEEPRWSMTRYADVIGVVNDGNTSVLPQYLQTMIKNTIQKINSLWLVSSAQE